MDIVATCARHIRRSIQYRVVRRQVPVSRISNHRTVQVTEITLSADSTVFINKVVDETIDIPRTDSKVLAVRIMAVRARLAYW